MKWSDLVTVCVLLSATLAAAQDANTSLLLHFDGNLNGANGEAPTQASGVSFEAGITNLGALLSDGDVLQYSTSGNLESEEGTLEFWLKPNWNGMDGGSYVILANGGAGGMLFAKDGANNLRSIFNRFGVGGQPEAGVAFNVSDWQAGAWHHVAYTWSDSRHRLRLYIDGQLIASSPLTIDLPVVSSTTFQLGAEGGGAPLRSVLDEVHISNVERSAAEIAASFLAQVNVLSISVEPASLTLLETWTHLPTIQAQTNLGPMTIPPASALWSSSNELVVRVDPTGLIRAVWAGQATLTANINGADDAISVTVHAPVRQPEEDPIHPYLSQPPACYLYEMPVAIIRYMPTEDGINVDSAIADYFGTIDDLKAWIDQLNIETKFMLEEGSRFRDYGANQQKPALAYRVVKSISVFEPLPPDLNPAHFSGSPGIYFPDYNQILERFDARHLVEDLGAKEIWLWGYHHGNIAPVESNMSSPTTGDISNSHRFQDDLPIFDRTYVLYNYNFTRSSNESVHNHGHQLEAILSHVNTLQDGNANLFWRQFVGQNQFGQFITGRCGWTHMPPNTTSHYDYNSAAVVPSDIAAWTPAGGPNQQVSAQTWTNINYSWPGGNAPQDLSQHHWYIYWMQSMPGWGNQIPHGSNYMTNWWTFTGEWDSAISTVSPSWGLYAPSASPSQECPPAPIPAVSTWGIIAISLGLGVAGTILIRCESVNVVSTPRQARCNPMRIRH